MPADGLGPEITSAHVAVTASFRGMANSVQREAQSAGRNLGKTLTSNASSGARSAGEKAGSEFGGGFSEKTSEAFKNVFLYGGAYTAISGIRRALGAASSAVIGFNSKIEQSDVAFKGLLGSSQAAESELSWIKDFAKTTPFQFGDLLTDDQQLIAMGASAKEAHTEITAIGDAAAGLGRGKDEIDKMVLAIGQMTSKGRIQSDELLQLQEAGIPALKMLAEAYDTTADKMQKAITAGLIKSDQAVPALIASIEKRFQGQMANQSKTFAGAVSNIEDTLQQGLAEAGKGAFDELNKAAHDFLDYLNSPAGQKTIEEVGQAFTDAAKGADFLAHHLWDARTPLLLLGGGFLALKVGEAVLVRGAGAAGKLAAAYQGAGSESSLAAKLNDAYTASLRRMTSEAKVAAGAAESVAAAQVAQAERTATSGKITAETSAFNNLPTYYGAQRGGVQASTYKQTQAAMDGAEASASKLSISAAGVGRAFASAAPLIGIGTLAVTSFTGTTDTAAGKVADFAASGALLGSMVGPWGALIGAGAGGLGGAFLSLEGNINAADDALDSLASSTSWDQLDALARKGSTSAVGGDWFSNLSHQLGFNSGDAQSIASALQAVGSSVSEAENAAKGGARAWRDYESDTLSAAKGSDALSGYLDDLRAGALNVKAAEQALAESNFAASDATYKTADAFIAAAKQAGFTSQEIDILSASARSVPTGASIMFSTNALAVMQQVEDLKSAISNKTLMGVEDDITAGGASANAKQHLKQLQDSLTTNLTYSPTDSGGLALPSTGSKAKGAKKAKKAYSVDIFDPFTDTGWEQLTGGKIAKDLAKMQDQADKAFAAMKKGSMSFSRSMKDLAHGKELKKAFKDIEADSKKAMSSMREQIKSTKFQASDLTKDMVQMGKDIASAINPADFGMDVTGATDFFGNPIAGSTEAAYKAQLQQQGSNLSGELADANTLSGWGLSGDYLSQLIQSNNKTLLDELVQGGQAQALQIFNMTKSNDSIAQQIGAQTAAQTTAYAADRAEAATLQKKINVLADFVTQIKKDDKDGKLSKKELAKIAKYGDELKKAFKAATS